METLRTGTRPGRAWIRSPRTLGKRRNDYHTGGGTGGSGVSPGRTASGLWGVAGGVAAGVTRRADAGSVRVATQGHAEAHGQVSLP